MQQKSCLHSIALVYVLVLVSVLLLLLLLLLLLQLVVHEHIDSWSWDQELYSVYKNKSFGNFALMKIAGIYSLPVLEHKFVPQSLLEVCSNEKDFFPVK